MARSPFARSVFEHLREAIMIVDADVRILDVNPAFTSITGYRRDEVVGENPRILNARYHPPSFFQQMFAALEQRGSWTGEIHNRRKDGRIIIEYLRIDRVFDEAGSSFHYLALFSDITGLRAEQDELEKRAHYDALTGLPNRLLLADRLQQAIHRSDRHGDTTAVMFIDLDGFKAINDTHGHEAGDDLLVCLSQRMSAALRCEDTLARIGGDEFVAVVDLEHDSRSFQEAANRLLMATSEPVMLRESSVSVSASIGITLYPHDSSSGEQLLRHADQAMYRAKQAGKQRYECYDPVVEAKARANLGMLRKIQQGLTRNEFVLYYQPQVDCRLGRVTGIEALLRWNHPILGLRGPGEFLPLVENEPVMLELGDWVIARALCDLKIVDEQLPGNALRLSINVTASQLLDPGFAPQLEAMLLAKGPELARRIDIEVVETAALSDMVRVGNAIAQCNRMGVEVALDDFGTGYSSLSHLKHLPVGALKIDQSFVRDMLHDVGDLAITNGVIGLASAFGCRVIAEGAERIEQMLTLMSLGCDTIQGFGIARPMALDTLLRWLASFAPDPRLQLVGMDFPRLSDFELLLAEVQLRHEIRQMQGTNAPRPLPRPYAAKLGRWLAHPEVLARHGSNPILGALCSHYDSLRQAADVPNDDDWFASATRLLALTAALRAGTDNHHLNES